MVGEKGEAGLGDFCVYFFPLFWYASVLPKHIWQSSLSGVIASHISWLTKHPFQTSFPCLPLLSFQTSSNLEVTQLWSMKHWYEIAGQPLPLFLLHSCNSNCIPGETITFIHPERPNNTELGQQELSQPAFLMMLLRHVHSQLGYLLMNIKPLLL